MTGPGDKARSADDTRAFQATYARAREAMGSLKNVVGVGLGAKHTAGAYTEVVAFVVFVDQKERAQDLAPADRVPATFEGYRTDVRVVEHPQPGACDNRATYETIQGGIQITLKVVVLPMGPGLLPGTLSCIVRRRNDPSHENCYILSNKHVLYGLNSGANDFVYHPFPPEQSPTGTEGKALGPVMPGGIFDNAPFLADPTLPPVSVFLDCAIARVDLDSTCCGSTCTKDKVKTAETIIDLNRNGVNTMSNVRNVLADANFVGESVWKVGRTTGKTRGKVRFVDSHFHTTDPTIPTPPIIDALNTIGIEFEAEPPHPPDPPPPLTNCHGNTWFAERGDSGSIVVDAQNRVVGIITHVPLPPGATPTALSYACHIVPILDRLGICIPCTPGGAHGTTSATDGSGLQRAAKTTPTTWDTQLVDGQVAFARSGGDASEHDEPALPALMHLSDSELDVMQARLAALRATPRGRALHDMFGEVRREVGYLIRNVRPVTVAWHRHKGPAFMTHVLNHLAGHTDRIPHDVQGVTRGDLLTRMREVLAVRGSNPLREALAQYGDDLFAMATGPDCHTIEDCIALLQQQEREVV